MSFPIRNEVDGEYVLQMDPCRSKLGFVMKYKTSQTSLDGEDVGSNLFQDESY